MEKEHLVAQLFIGLDATLEILSSEEFGQVSDKSAQLVARYYQTLCREGVPPEHAARIAAGFASNATNFK